MLKVIQVVIAVVMSSLIAVVLYHGVILGEFSNKINF